MIISDLRNNKLVFETMACDSMSYLDHPGDPNVNAPPIVRSTIFDESLLIYSYFKPLCQPAIWDMQYHCFYRMRGSMARRISDLLQHYPSLRHENGALMWLSNMPDNAFVVCGTVVCFCIIKIKVALTFCQLDKTLYGRVLRNALEIHTSPHSRPSNRATDF
jgi:hypothetical protein